MRIVAGSLKGRKITVVEDGIVRPTKDRVREAIFSSLLSIRSLEGARILDLFAGTGALGIEAISRGAREAVFVESHAATANWIKRTVETFGVLAQSKIINDTAERFITLQQKEGTAAFDVLFVDPPYSMSDIPGLLTSLAESSLTRPESLVVYECSSTAALPSTIPISVKTLCLSQLKVKTYGETKVGFYTFEKTCED